MIAEIDGFRVIPYPELRKKLLALADVVEPLDAKPHMPGVVTDHKLFIQSQINILDRHQPKEKMSNREKILRLRLKPMYERLLKYYYLRTQLIEA